MKKKMIEKQKKLDLQTETVRALARPDLVVGGRSGTIVAGTDGNCTTSACSC